MDTVTQLDNICESIKNLQKKKTDLTKEMSDINSMQQDILHQIENEEKINFMRAWDFIRGIQKIRKRRRKVKNELTVLESVLPNVLKLKDQMFRLDQKAKTEQNKMNYLVHNKKYNNRIANFNTDIDREIDKCLGKFINENIK